jgi:ATP-binding cassette subfamily B protein
MAIYSQKLIDKILPSGEMRILLVSSGLVFLLLVTRIIISCIRQMFILMQGKIFNIRVVDDFFNSLLFLRKSFFDTRRTGDFVARLNDTMRIQRVIADIISIYIIDILVILITTVILFYYSVAIGLISLTFLPLFYLMVSSRNKRIITSQYDLMAGYASNESNFIDSIKGIAEIKSLNWQNLFSRRNKVVYSDFQEKAYNLGKIKVQLTLITGIAGSVYLVAILICSSSFVMKKELSQGELMAIISLASSILPSALNLALISIPLSEVKVAVNRMFEYTQIESESIDDTENIGLKPDKLILKDISFRFPGQRLLLEKINLEIERGKIASLIGESGSGKSTIAGIILRFYDPEEGKLLIGNECNAMEVNLNAWRSKIAVIPQEIHIFNGTIIQNLIDEPDETKVNELLAALSEIGLVPFINSFPSGLLTIVGEAGINLSGGQKQVLAFIRAILTKPDILIIDEDTSNMDRKTEALIIDIILKLKSKMGILFISHRLNMIKKLSDIIYILEDRTIKSCGKHEDLLSGINFYSSLWKDFD